MRMTVTFTSQGRILEAALFLPPENTTELSPALLFEGSMTGATQQVSERMAHELSEEGFVCLVLDHSFYGDDEALAQAWESPGKRVQDIKAGLKFLSEQSAVNESAVVGVGVSVGAEYLAQAIHDLPLCKGFVMVQGPFDDSQNYIETLGVPTLIVDENNLDGAVDEISIWVRSLMGSSEQKPSPSIDWSMSEK